ncbi:MAG: 4Fe-4S dicluster domain-containing protein [Bacteroidales bacterium]|nr:4Fe-4S dicluster domain-containing protein [Bacteroidales bacterium]
MCPTITKSHAKDETMEEYWREPLDAAKHKSPTGIVNLIKDRCKSCEFCIEFCPHGILELSDEFNAKGYHPPRVVDGGSCIACRLCELICPEFAIYITETNHDHD